MPEGTRQLGHTQGIESHVFVFARDGETIKLCSSDDGRQEPDVNGGIAIDDSPGAANDLRHFPEGSGIELQREGAEIVVYAPNAARCGAEGDPECGGGTSCRGGQGEPVAVDERGTCGFVRAVGAARGYCNAATPANLWNEIDVDVEGDWEIDFVGEQETITASGASTRFFEVDVVVRVEDADDVPIDGGRLHFANWRINSHTFDYGADTDFFVVADVGDGARVWVIDFEDLRGFRFQMFANRIGLVDHPRQSWCLTGDPDGNRDCLDDRPSVRFRRQYELYLNYPDPAPGAPAEAVIENVEFNDEIGTISISPNGDGEQDDGVFSFDVNLDGSYEIVIDTDGNGELDLLVDRVLAGEAHAGPNTAEWDGRDRDGVVVAPGDYLFRIMLITAETHFPMIDIENNETGFTIWEQAGPGAGRVAQLMFWDDRALRRDLIGGDDVATTLPDGSTIPPAAHQTRPWRQPNIDGRDISMVFDTWVIGERLTAERASCDRCEADVGVITVNGPEGDEVPDDDGDGIPNDVEDGNGNGVVDPGETDPALEDSDGDGVKDGDEDRNRNGQQDDGETSPVDADSDDDGLDDGVEDANQDGVRDDGETDPLDADSDDDGLDDGEEDRNHNGVRDDGETDPLDADSDDDALEDGAEVNAANGTDPNDADSDDDGLEDGQEVNGANATDPNLADTDGDGINDGDEDRNRNGAVDDGETDPTVADSDEDGIEDGDEDRNANGVVDDGESDPLDPDSDDDGLLDGVEDRNHDGVLDADESSPVSGDTDADGIPDNVEDANGDGVRDPTETHPNDADSDDDGLDDGVEDADQDGQFERDDGETDPRDADTDNGGEPDGSEVAAGRNPLNGVDDNGGDLDDDGDGLTNAREAELGTDPNNPDSDGDGIEDGVEDGAGYNPLSEDSDGDGLRDGSEDANLDGMLDPGESSPTETDTDGDGLDDLGESMQDSDPQNPDTDEDGLGDLGESMAGSDPRNPDTDGGGELDGTDPDPINPTDDDQDHDGLTSVVEMIWGSDPENPDSDGDGRPDGEEDRNGDGVLDDDETDPTDEDTDDDGLLDPVEDADGDGVVDRGETNAREPDTDGDGVPDGAEDRNGNGEQDEGEWDPLDADSDDDGLEDGQEDANRDGRYEEGVETNPLSADTDGDGVLDGSEDSNLNGMVDLDETDPRVPDNRFAGDAGVGDGGPQEVAGRSLFDGCAQAPGPRSGGWSLLLLLLGLRRRR